MVANGVGMLRAVGNDALLRAGARRTEVWGAWKRMSRRLLRFVSEAQVKARACLQRRFNLAGQRRLAIPRLRIGQGGDRSSAGPAIEVRERLRLEREAPQARNGRRSSQILN